MTSGADRFQTPEEVATAAAEIAECIRGAHRLMWRAAEVFAALKRTPPGVLQAAGYDKVWDIGHEVGLCSAHVKRLIRVHRFAKESGMDLSDMCPTVVDRIRKVPEEELQEVVAAARNLRPPDFWEWFHGRYSRKRRRKVRVIKAEEYKEYEAESIEDVPIEPGAIVIVGGSVVSGVDKEADTADAEE